MYLFEVISVNVADKAVTLADGDTIHYSKLVLATGGTPRQLSCPGADLQGVFYLRTPEDGQRIAESVQGRDVVVIGSSFIGRRRWCTLVDIRHRDGAGGVAGREGQVVDLRRRVVGTVPNGAQ
jgi:NAD(P)H-nitrite reductase large subunit